MKYFFIIIIILFAITYQVSSTNDETLAEAEAEVEVFQSEEVKVANDDYQKIDLKKITLNSSTSTSSVAAEDSIDDEDHDNPDTNDIGTSDDTTDQEDSEINEEYVESKFSQEGHLVHKPDIDGSASQSAMEKVRWDMVNKSRRPAENSKEQPGE